MLNFRSAESKICAIMLNIINMYACKKNLACHVYRVKLLNRNNAYLYNTGSALLIALQQL